MKYKLVIFDFDGTLMDTSEGIYDCGKRAMSAVGLKIPENANWKEFIGPPLSDCFRFAFFINDDETLQNLCFEYRKLYSTEGYKKACFYPGIRELLFRLKREGYKIAVASMKGIDLIEKMNDYYGISCIMDCCMGQTPDDNTVDKKTLLDRLCSSFDVSRSECIMIGDTYYDADGAKLVGMDCIKVNFGFGFTPEDEGTVSTADEIYRIITER